MPPMISRAWASPSRASRVEPVRVGGRAERLLRELRRAHAGHVALEVAAAGARALAGDAVELDHRVPELGPAAVEPAVEDDAAAAARAERQHHHRLGAAAGAGAVLGERRHVRVVLERRPEARAGAPCRPARSTSRERDVHRADDPAALSSRDGTPKPTAPTPSSSSSRDRRLERREQVLLRARRRRVLAVALDLAVASTIPARIFVPPTSTPMTRCALTGGGYHNPPHGRRAEAVPRLPRRPRQGQGADSRAAGARADVAPAAAAAGRSVADYRGPGRSRSAAASTRGRTIALVLVLLVLLFVVWGVVGYLSFRSGVNDANKRLSDNARAALNHQSGLLLSHASDILLLGTDHSDDKTRAGDQHSDSIMLVRSDPHRHRITFLSIPRDLRVAIPGHGDDKINAAYQIGGPALAIKTVRSFTGLPRQPRRARRLRQLQDADRQDRRGHDRRPAERSSRTSSTARTRRRRVRQVAGLALREGPAAHERDARARSTRGSGRTATTRARATSRAASGSSRCCRRSRTSSSAPARSPDCRSSAATCSSRSRPTCPRASCSSSAGSSSAGTRCAAGSAAPREPRRRGLPPARRGGPQRDRDGARPVRAAAAAAGLDLRLRLPRRLSAVSETAMVLSRSRAPRGGTPNPPPGGDAIGNCYVSATRASRKRAETSRLGGLLLGRSSRPACRRPPSRPRSPPDESEPPAPSFEPPRFEPRP